MICKRIGGGTGRSAVYVLATLIGQTQTLATHCTISPILLQKGISIQDT